MALYLSALDEPFLMVEKTEEAADALWKDVLFYRRLMKLGEEVLCLHDADGPTRSGHRAKAAHTLGSCPDCSVIASVEAMGEKLWSSPDLESRVVTLHKGGEMERDSLEEALKEIGYARVPLVTEAGQFSRRGFIFDVFPTTKDAPVRVEFFGDQVDNMRLFDVDSQRSKSNIESLIIYPAVEDEVGVDVWEIAGDRSVFTEEGAYDEAPESSVTLSRFSIEGEGADAGTLPIAGLGVLPEERGGLDDLPKAIDKISGTDRVVIVCSSEGQALRLKDILKDGGVIAPFVEIKELLRYEGNVSITVGELSSGLRLPGLVILTELEVFGGRPSYRPLKRSKVAKLMTKVEDLAKGDLIVHYDHGIGQFQGMARQTVEGHDVDLMVIDYAEGGRLYLPLHAIGKIKKYHAEEAATPKLDTLGTKTWQRKRERVRKRIKELASKLLKIYAERRVAKGFRFSADTEMHREFESFFPYEETPDQLKAIEDIKRDMEAEEPMDRLLAGDVGYGKTEVAMRAAFKAAFDGKQVAVLVPTTLLCEQHYRIFRKRFSAFPIAIDYISRFKTPKERTKTLGDIAKGRVDIVIATHALLKKGIAFRDLGLLVIDEEHRFGVGQKERIKEIKSGVDVLALSATPIPRTLQMSLSGIRKMSIIETAPEERVATSTTVSVFRDNLIKEAIEKELQRGGQTFFVHNRIHDIGKYARLLGQLLPEARIEVAHGQMSERSLEGIMLRFLNGDIDVLIATAIVGSGLDIPTANTIIIDMAHRMGLADLYQLKGRVGRSDVRAHAYFLIPPGVPIPDDAARRLQAIQELNYMGAGFRLAMKDLEIRGAGNMLGAEQSGYIDAVGFDLYIEMLEKAVSELRGIEVREPVRTSISITCDALIPDDYIDDMTLRLSAYRAISGVSSHDDIESIKAEMRDRFGTPPEEFLNLLRIMELRLLAEPLGITGITQIGKRVKFVFQAEAGLKADDIVAIFGKGIRFYPAGFDITAGDAPLETVRHALDSMRKTFNKSINMN